MINESEFHLNRESAPSIGRIELSFDPAGDRARQISTTVITTTRQLHELLYIARGFTRAMQGTRTVVRSLVEKDYLNEALQNAEEIGYQCEAAMPLSSQGFEQTPLVYFGSNTDRRVTNNFIRRNEQSLLTTIVETPVKLPGDVVQTAANRGFGLERLDGSLSEVDYQQLKRMYENSFSSYPFEINAAISDLVAQPTSIVFAARSESDGMLHSVCAAEQLDIPVFDGRNLRIWEMGDSARLESGKGLNAALKVAIIAQSARHNVDLLFCESRAALRAVNQINHSIGMKFRGTLIKHTLISGPEDIAESSIDGYNGRYGNMNVWSLNRSQIAEIALKTGGVE